MTLHQVVYDNAHKRWWNGDGDVSHAAQNSMQAMRATYGMDIYCQVHHANHLLDSRAVEELLYALQGALGDEQGEDPLPDRDAGWENVARMCPLDQLGSYKDPECYGEHIESMLGARQGAERTEL